MSKAVFHIVARYILGTVLLLALPCLPGLSVGVAFTQQDLFSKIGYSQNISDGAQVLSELRAAEERTQQQQEALAMPSGLAQVWGCP